MNVDFETLLALSPNPYVVMSPDLTIQWMNEAYLRATMRRRDEIIGKKMFDAFPSDEGSDSHRLLEGSLKRVLHTGEIDELALIRYDIRETDGSMSVRYWSATHTPIKDEYGKVAYILQHTVDVTELQGLRRLRDESGLVERAHAVQARNLDLAKESEWLKRLFEQAPGFMAILRGPSHTFVMANEAYRALIGQRNVIGKPVADALPEVVEQGSVMSLDKVYRTGEPYFGRAEKIELEQADGTVNRYLDFIYQPIFTDEGDVSGVFVQGHDVTDGVESLERQKLLINELNHRVKNTLSIVQGLASQSFRQLEGSHGARQVFDARLNALAAAHSMLTERNWKSAHLTASIRSSVEATAGLDIERFRIEGPNICLAPQTAVSLTMMIHELTTNALKYGALSHPAGRVDIRWKIERDDGTDHLTLDWMESGGPRVEPPSRHGFGSRLIRSGMSLEKGNEVDMDFNPEGLHCRIKASLISEAE